MQLAGSGVVSYPLAGGDLGTEQTIVHIRRLVDEALRDPEVNRAAIEILKAAGATGYDAARQARAIFHWVVRRIGYVPDPVGKELLRPANVILRVGVGDCDEINAILLPALLGSVGIRTRLVTISTHPEYPEEFSHVYCEAWFGGQWVPLDAARRGASWLRRPARGIRKRVWSLTSNEYEDIRGLAGLARDCPQPQNRMAGLTPRQRRRMVRPGIGRIATRPAAIGLGFSWADFGNILNSGTQSAVNIISALKGQPGNAAAAYLPASTQAVQSQDYTPLMIGALAIGGLLLLRKN